jgi:hypothetical protein
LVRAGAVAGGSATDLTFGGAAVTLAHEQLISTVRRHEVGTGELRQPREDEASSPSKSALLDD